MKVLVFSDSRGTHVNPKYDTFQTYARTIEQRFDADVLTRPEYWTTILDFLAFIEDATTAYDRIVLHAGIVDWLPKPVSYMEDVLRSRIIGREETKQEACERLFAGRDASQPIRRTMQRFRGEATTNLYTMEMAQAFVIPKLEAVENLLFVGANPILSTWEGDYPNGPRARNSNLVQLYSRMFERRLRSVELSSWTSEDVMARTHDNIHLNATGDAHVLARILTFLDEG